MTRMKDSGIEWIGEIPEEWEVKPLKYLVSYDDEVLSQSEINSNIQIKYVDISSVNLTDGISSFHELLSLDAPSRARRVAKRGDTIVSTVRTYLKAIAYVESNFIVSTGFCVLRPQKIDSKYLNYAVMSDYFTEMVSKYAWGVSYPAISSSQLVNISIAFPISIKEQARIADFLDKKVTQLDKIKALLEEQITTLQNYRQSLIYETVTKGLDKTAPMKDSGVDWIGEIPEGWGVKPIKYLTEFKNGYAFDSNELTSEDTGYKVIRIGDFKPSGIDFEEALSYGGENIRKLQQYKIKQDQILIAMSGATVGKTSYVSEEIEVISFINQRVGIIDSASSEMNRFIYYWLSAKSFTEYILLNSNGSAQPNISGGQIGEFLIPLPNERDIKDIVKYLDSKTIQLDEMITIKQKQIDNINQQRQTLIYDVVTGKSAL